MTKPPLRIGALIGGGGRTLLNIADAIDRGELDAEIAVVVASKRSIPGVQRAQQRGFVVHVVDELPDKSFEAVNDAIYRWMDEARIDLICLCGWLRALRIDERWRGRIMNIHPALLPDFGGKGMYGHHVHEAVLTAKRTESGCTVHFIDEHYDHGPAIIQRTCPVLPGDTAETLAARVFAEECIAYPQAIAKYAAGHVRLQNNRTVWHVDGLPGSDAER